MQQQHLWTLYTEFHQMTVTSFSTPSKISAWGKFVEWSDSGVACKWQLGCPNSEPEFLCSFCTMRYNCSWIWHRSRATSSNAFYFSVFVVVASKCCGNSWAPSSICGNNLVPFWCNLIIDRKPTWKCVRYWKQLTRSQPFLDVAAFALTFNRLLNQALHGNWIL